MAALVADYSSSESDGETERPGGSGRLDVGQGGRSEPAADPEGGDPRRGDVSADRLPPPELDGGRAREEGAVGVGVFTNPFAREQRERLRLLEKHVRLTAPPGPQLPGGPKICLAYRKDGRCRYGVSCRFAHDSDLPGAHPPEPDPASSSRARPGDKRRPGLSPGLLPPKRSLKDYQAQRAKEGLGLL